MSPASYRAAPPRGGDTTVANRVRPLQIASGRRARPAGRRARRRRASRRRPRGRPRGRCRRAARLLGRGRGARLSLIAVDQPFQRRLRLADLYRILRGIGVLERLDRLVDLLHGDRAVAGRRRCRRGWRRGRGRVRTAPGRSRGIAVALQVRQGLTGAVPGQEVGQRPGQRRAVPDPAAVGDDDPLQARIGTAGRGRAIQRFDVEERLVQRQREQVAVDHVRTVGGVKRVPVDRLVRGHLL